LADEKRSVVGYGCYCMLVKALPTAELLSPTKSAALLLKTAQSAFGPQGQFFCGFRAAFRTVLVH